jgi:hypothetical protein
VLRAEGEQLRLGSGSTHALRLQLHLLLFAGMQLLGHQRNLSLAQAL